MDASPKQGVGVKSLFSMNFPGLSGWVPFAISGKDMSSFAICPFPGKDKSGNLE